MPANVLRRLRIVSSASSASRRVVSLTSLPAGGVTDGWVEFATPAADAAADADADDDDDTGAAVDEVVLQLTIKCSHYSRSTDSYARQRTCKLYANTQTTDREFEFHEFYEF